DTNHLTAVTYEQGYHMLTRDLQAMVVMEDIAAWIAKQEAPSSPASDMQSYCAGQQETGTD
ncbi:MAG: hypothetical protein JSW45_04005, partial [Thiotrichales bacterium]